MLHIQNIAKSYPSASGLVKHKVLNGLSADFPKGHTVAIVGPSGSGKTTLLNILGTLDKADEGSVNIDGVDIGQLQAREQAEFRNRKIGMVFQLHHLLPQCTLWENILLPVLPFTNDVDAASKRAEALLKRTGIWEQRFQKPASLSGGECQRAAVVRALINQPSIILADEPTGALDEDNAEKLSSLLLELNKEMGTTLVVVTHSPGLAARMDQVYELHSGKLHLRD
ncbi:ABC transporter ATP-binding protein [Roseimarinus sediminis]|uniref:ABC transporter ATP-binding protein n=1 Tax=Roseimarinus sediminis TaxID=1610899 RepID=UPI003D1E72FB